MASILNKMFPLDVTKVVFNYEQFLQSALVTTTSFQDILDGKLNRRNRFWQLLYLIYLLVYFLPKSLFLSYAYTRNTATRVYYQQLLADYAEEFGLLGRTHIVCCVAFFGQNVLNTFFLRRYESKASLHFLTNWLHRIPGKTSSEENNPINDDLDDESKKELISQLHYKTVMAKLAARQTNFALAVFETIAFVMFLYNQRPSLLVSCLATFNWFTFALYITFPGCHFHALYLSFIAVTDYFLIRIQQTQKRVIQLQTSQLTDKNMTQVLNDYDQLMSVFKKYSNIRHLLRNMVQFYAFGLTGVLFLGSTITEPWMAAFIITIVAGYALMILANGIYISQLHSKVFQLHSELASIPARHSRNRGVSLKNLLRLKLAIKELGSLETNGQFVIGLRDGDGAATSRQEIFDLTMTTLANTLMLMDITK